MKILRHEILINKGGFPGKNQVLIDIKTAISKVVWPSETNTFTINPTPKGNGVKTIKKSCMEHLKSKGWELEKRIQVLADTKPGPLDAAKSTGNNQIFAFEWETGNISSSHRAMNKMAMGMLERKLVGGVLVLPSRSMYKFLTDRVGNFQEEAVNFSV